MVIFVLGAMEADKPKSHRLIKPQAAKWEGRYWKNFSYREFIQQQKESIHRRSQQIRKPLEENIWINNTQLHLMQLEICKVHSNNLHKYS